MKELKITYFSKDKRLPAGIYYFKKPNIYCAAVYFRKPKAKVPPKIYKAILAHLGIKEI